MKKTLIIMEAIVSGLFGYYFNINENIELQN